MLFDLTILLLRLYPEEMIMVAQRLFYKDFYNSEN